MVAATLPTLASAVLDLIEARATSDPLNALRDVLHMYVQQFHSTGSLVQEAVDDEVLLHVSPSLTVYHITLSPGVQYPPHNHLMDALVGIYKGSEMNLIYSPRDGSRVSAATRQEVHAPSVIHMDANAVHAVANTGPGRSGALHVYLGDLPGTRRQLWAADGLQPEDFDNARYLVGARPIALNSNLEGKETS